MNEELIRALDGITSAIEHLDQTLFDTLGSAEAGDALKAIAETPDCIRGLSDEVSDVGNKITGRKY